jgi:hypothetical protein
MDNPYRVLGAEDPPMMGRRTLLWTLGEHLEKPDPDHVSVIGPAMYGKGVFLRELARRYAAGRPGYTTALYVNFRHRTPTTDDEFRELVAGEMHKALRAAEHEAAGFLELHDIPIKERFQALAEELVSKGDRVLLVLDGFDRVLTHPGITRDLWENLRLTAARPHVRFVTGSRRPIRDLCHDEESRTSDFWEIFFDSPVEVGAFEASDWDDLLEPFGGIDVAIEPDARVALAAWTGGVPVLTTAFLQSLWRSSDKGSSVDEAKIDRTAERVLDRRRELLEALWDDCSAELKTDLADLASRELKTSQVPEGRLRELELRGFAGRKGKRVVSTCRLIQRFASTEAHSVDSLQRLFGDDAQFKNNVRMLLEMRLAQVPDFDTALRGYVEQAIRHIDPEPRHSLVWVRGIVDRALDLVWDKELKDGVTIPPEWVEEWEKARLRFRPDDGTGRLPDERGRQTRVLAMATGVGIRGRSVPRLTKYVSRPTSLLIEHLQSVGNFGQHQKEGEADRPFAVATCMTAITLCASLARDLGVGE